MREVINRAKSSKVFSDSVSDEKYYGIDQYDSDEKGWIGRSNYYGEMRAFCQKAVSSGNEWDHLIKTRDLKLFIDDLIVKDFKVYEFDTCQELFLWLAK